MRRLRPAARLLRVGLRPAGWALAAAGVACVAFAPPERFGFDFPFGVPAGGRPVALVNPAGSGLGRDLPGAARTFHPVVLNVRRFGPVRPGGRPWTGWRWFGQPPLGLCAMWFPVGVAGGWRWECVWIVSPWPPLLAACLLGWGVRRVLHTPTHGRRASPPSLTLRAVIPRLVRPWVWTAAVVGAVLVAAMLPWPGERGTFAFARAGAEGSVFGVRSVVQMHGPEHVIEAPGPTPWAVGRGTGLRAGRAVEFGGLTYLFFAARLPFVLGVPLLADAVVLFRRLRRRPAAPG